MTSSRTGRCHGDGRCQGDGRLATGAGRCHGDGRLATDRRRATERPEERPPTTRFFCNGDEFYAGHEVYVTRKRYPTVDRLLVDLSRLLAGPVNLPHGVRQIFRAGDGKRVGGVEEIVADERRRFVCAGFEAFRPIQYGQRSVERWRYGKSAPNSLSPRDIVFKETSRSIASIETGVTATPAKTADKFIHNSNTTPRRSNPKPARPHYQKKVSGFKPGETVTHVEMVISGETVTPWDTVTPGNMVTSGGTFASVSQYRSEGNRDKGETSKAADHRNSCSRKLNCTEVVSLTHRADWLRGSHRTQQDCSSSSSTALTSGNTKHVRESASSCSESTHIRNGPREVTRSPTLLDIEGETLENVECLESAQERSPTTEILKSSEKSREVSVDSQTVATASPTNPESSHMRSLGFIEIPITFLETPRETSENPVSSTQANAVSSTSIEKSAGSLSNPSSCPLPLGQLCAFPQTPAQNDTQAVPKVQSGIETDAAKFPSTRASRNSTAKSPEPLKTNSRIIRSADRGQLISHKKGSKSRKRETPPKSNRRIVEFGFLAKRFEMGDVLGEGTFATVRRCRVRQTGAWCAVKVISRSKLKGREEVVENEVRILRSCKHANIVRLIERYDTTTEVYVVLELVEGGDLFEAIRSRQRFPEVEATSMVKDMARALQYLHHRKIVHRDVKPENLLVQLGSDGSVKCLKLADFGLAVLTTGLLFKLCGTPTYVAPEILSDIGYSLEVDLWSVGVILYVLLCGYPPFRSSRLSDSELFALIRVGQFVFDSPRWDHISDGARDLICHLLEINVKKRLQANEVLRHPWIRTGSVDSNPVCNDHLRSSVQQHSLSPPVAIDNDHLSAPNTNRATNPNMGVRHPHR